ncbi:MAG: ATP-binding protein, partial [Proteobacteria bacterium]|nr:ATP-binding protein [Pseudomonadota bacterium]
MSFTATLFDLIKGCPRNIKRRLLRDILLILFVTSGAILTIVMVQGIKTQNDISTALINDSNRLVKKRFQSFTTPLNNTMRLLAKWGESNLLRLDDPELLARQFQALMEIQPTISSIALADTEANEVSLSHHNNQWLLYQHRKGRSITSSVINGKLINREENPNDSYNPAQSVWFRGAMTIAPAGNLFLTDPHILRGSEDVGITASLSWSRRDTPNNSFISSFSFTIKELMLFMEDLEITENGQILLLQKDGSLLNNLRNNNMQPSGAVSLQKGKNISEQLLSAVTRKLQESPSPANDVISIKNDNTTWWLGFTPLHDLTSDLWVAIVIPQSDIFSNLRNQWLRFGMLAGSILLTGILMTIFLVRRYSHQLKDLPQQHIDSYGYENEIAALIRAGESSTLEFKSTMRTNLKSGKTGKEIELAWLKTVTAFMNSDGGILLIGVEDDGTVIGIDADNFANEDKCRLHFKNLINTHIGAESSRFIHLKILTIQEKTILIIECERVRRPVFLSVGKNEDFFIRSGPSSMKLSMSQMINYLA